MKSKNGELLDAILPAVEKLGEARPPEVSVATMLKVRRILRKLREGAADVSAIRNDFLNQWGKKDEEGKLVLVGETVQFAPGDRARFLMAQKELYASEWDYEGPTLTLEDLGEFPFTGGFLADLGDVFEDEALAEEEE